jgi:hypothetical protein
MNCYKEKQRQHSSNDDIFSKYQRKNRKGRNYKLNFFLEVGIQNMFIKVEEKLIQRFGYVEKMIVSDECVAFCMGGPHTCTLYRNIWTVVVCHHVGVNSCIFGWVSICMFSCVMVYGA